MASVFEVSICSGSAMTLCRRVTTPLHHGRLVDLGQADVDVQDVCARCPPAPCPQRGCTPCRARAAPALNLLLPVGLMRSPMMTGLGPISTACEKEETTVRCLGTGAANGFLPAHARSFCWMCAGVGAAAAAEARARPCSAISPMRSANSSASMSNTVVPFSLRGRPALGLTTMRKRADLGQPLDDRLHLLRAEAAVDAERVHAQALQHGRPWNPPCRR